MGPEGTPIPREGEGVQSLSSRGAQPAAFFMSPFSPTPPLEVFRGATWSNQGFLADRNCQPRNFQGSLPDRSFRLQPSPRGMSPWVSPTGGRDSPHHSVEEETLLGHKVPGVGKKHPDEERGDDEGGALGGPPDLGGLGEPYR